MFSVIFEVHPKPDQWDAYLDNAKMLRPELVQVDGFVDNTIAKSAARQGSDAPGAFDRYREQAICLAPRSPHAQNTNRSRH